MHFYCMETIILNEIRYWEVYLLTGCQKTPGKIQSIFECQMVYLSSTLRFLFLFFLYILCRLVLSTPLETRLALQPTVWICLLYSCLIFFPWCVSFFVACLLVKPFLFFKTLYEFLNKQHRSRDIWWIFHELMMLQYHKHSCLCV